MNHRERVQITLNHEIPDRCPMQISFTPEFAKRLERDLDIKGIKAHNPHGGGNVYALERGIDEDMLLTSVGWANSYYQDKEEYTDEWGIGWRSQEYETPLGSVLIRKYPIILWQKTVRLIATDHRIHNVRNCTQKLKQRSICTTKSIGSLESR